MNVTDIQRELAAKVSAEIRVEPDGADRLRIRNPFQFDDGDHFNIVLRREGAGWVFTDEGTTYAHLSYAGVDLDDLDCGRRRAILERTLSAFGVLDREGELLVRPAGDHYAGALFSLIQTMHKVSDLRFLSREVARDTFQEDFRALMEECIPPDRLTFDWRHPVHDPSGIYPVDCRVNGGDVPLFVYALLSDHKTGIATIALLTFERWRLPHRSLGLFRNQEEIERKALARFTDVCDRQFSSLETNRERIAQYLAEVLRH